MEKLLLVSYDTLNVLNLQLSI